MTALQRVADEAGYRRVREIESRICAAQPERWHFHHGSLGVDRYFFGAGAGDFFTYAHLVLSQGNLAGYALVYRSECLFHLALLPPYTAGMAAEALRAVEACFPKGASIGADVSCLEAPLVDALRAGGYTEGPETRFQGVAPLASYRGSPASIAPLYPALLEERDIAERVRYAALPTGAPITEDMFRAYRCSEDAESVLDEVVRDPLRGALAAYLSWWIDRDSRTVMLNPAACIEAYRRQGILKSCLIRGLCALRDRGLRYAYVDTGIGNRPAVGLYEAAGFVKSGQACRYQKKIPM